MLKVRITAMARAEHCELMKKYENPLENACNTVIGSVFISENAEKPDGLCSEAWSCMYKFVKELSEGGGSFFGDWMKDPKSAMVSCNDGFRPVSFYLEAIPDNE